MEQILELLLNWYFKCLNAISLVIILPYLKRDKDGMCLLFQVTHQIKLFWNAMETVGHPKGGMCLILYRD